MKKILIGSFFLILAVLLLTAEPELRPYRLINSDYLTIDLVDGEYVTNLRGNVHFFYGDTEFLADEADLYEEQKIAYLRGNVQVYEDTLSLYCDQVEYHRLVEELILNRNVFIQEDHYDGTIRTFEADSARYHREEPKIYTFENSHFFDERESVQGVGNYLEYDLDEEYGFLTGQPVVSFAREDTIAVAAERIEFYREVSRVAASFDVRTSYTMHRRGEDEESEETVILYGDEGIEGPVGERGHAEPVTFNITSDFLLFFLEEDYAVFTGNPVFMSESADARAERFYVHFEDEQISAATLENDCEIFFAVSEGGDKNSVVKADLVELIFMDGDIRGMEAFENVQSLYVGDDEQDRVMNEAESDKLRLRFSRANEMEVIVFTGNVRGQYNFSERMID